MAVAFSQNLRSGRMSWGVADGKLTSGNCRVASRATGRSSLGWPVDRAPNANRTEGRTWPLPSPKASQFESPVPRHVLDPLARLADNAGEAMMRGPCRASSPMPQTRRKRLLQPQPYRCGNCVCWELSSSLAAISA